MNTMPCEQSQSSGDVVTTDWDIPVIDFSQVSAPEDGPDGAPAKGEDAQDAQSAERVARGTLRKRHMAIVVAVACVVIVCLAVAVLVL